jgi:hypothetical protein
VSVILKTKSDEKIGQNPRRKTARKRSGNKEDY